MKRLISGQLLIAGKSGGNECRHFFISPRLENIYSLRCSSMEVHGSRGGEYYLFSQCRRWSLRRMHRTTLAIELVQICSSAFPIACIVTSVKNRQRFPCTQYWLQQIVERINCDVPNACCFALSGYIYDARYRWAHYLALLTISRDEEVVLGLQAVRLLTLAIFTI